MTDKYAFFYADNGLVESKNLVWFQWLFGVVISLFERVGF